MKDRVSTKILSNGATRYGVYDEEGNLLRYEYIKLEDEPSTEGDLFNKANMLPDTIPSLLGLKMANPQVKDVLNVLANVGNLHVWQRTRVLSEAIPAVPAGYTLGEVEEDVSIALFERPGSGIGTDDRYVNYAYATAVAVDFSSGNVSLSGGTSTTQNFKRGTTIGTNRFIEFESPPSHVTMLGVSVGEVVYVPSDAEFTITLDTSNNEWGDYTLHLSKLQRVTGYPYTPEIPAGTHVDYLTSTDEDAYRESSNGSEAYYTLGDVVTGTRAIGFINKSMSESSPYVETASEIEVSEDGVVALKDAATIYTNHLSTAQDVKASIAGKYVRRPINSEIMFDSLSMLELAEVVYIPEDVSVASVTSTGLLNGAQYTYNDIATIDRYQIVTGHAAVPVDTTVVYLGQLGGGARIEFRSYVGTGTYGADNPVVIEGSRKIRVIIALGKVVVDTGAFDSPSSSGTTFCSVMHYDVLTTSFARYRGLGAASYIYGKRSADGKTFSWYTSSSGYDAYNLSGRTYYLLIIYD